MGIDFRGSGKARMKPACCTAGRLGLAAAYRQREKPRFSGTRHCQFYSCVTGWFSYPPKGLRRGGLYLQNLVGIVVWCSIHFRLFLSLCFLSLFSLFFSTSTDKNYQVKEYKKGECKREVKTKVPSL